MTQDKINPLNLSASAKCGLGKQNFPSEVNLPCLRLLAFSVTLYQTNLEKALATEIEMEQTV